HLSRASKLLSCAFGGLSIHTYSAKPHCATRVVSSRVWGCLDSPSSPVMVRHTTLCSQVYSTKRDPRR
ncbi:hypothetical protein CPB84DRAFT_1791408, partial [Gymnopilus junonius]